MSTFAMTFLASLVMVVWVLWIASALMRAKNEHEARMDRIMLASHKRHRSNDHLPGCQAASLEPVLSSVTGELLALVCPTPGCPHSQYMEQPGNRPGHMGAPL